jgi:formamidopyrimidine-DNA glycosylase
MPELPDVDVYVAALESRVSGKTLEQVRLNSPFLLRTVTPPLTEAHGKRVAGVRRVGKRVVIALEDELFLAIHLMIAGRLHWKPCGTKLAGKIALAAFDFSRRFTSRRANRGSPLWGVAASSRSRPRSTDSAPL